MQNNKVQYRAGVIPYSVEDEKIIHMMFMKPTDSKYGGDDFQIAKGKIEENEDTEVAAFREANEELGLFKGNITNVHDLGTFLGRTHIYLAEIKDMDMFGDPHFETKETTWMTPEEFQKTGRVIHRPVVKAAARMIKSKICQITEECNVYFNTTLFEMSNYGANTTGLMDGSMLWIRTEPNGLPHTKFRFKLNHPQNGSAVFGFWGDDIQQVAGNWTVTGKQLQLVQQFARTNKDSLISHINGQLDSTELGNKMIQSKI